MNPSSSPRREAKALHLFHTSLLQVRCSHHPARASGQRLREALLVETALNCCQSKRRAFPALRTNLLLGSLIQTGTPSSETVFLWGVIEGEEDVRPQALSKRGGGESVPERIQEVLYPRRVSAQHPQLNTPTPTQRTLGVSPTM